MSIFESMRRTAQFSACKEYRFRLGRHWDATRPVLLALMFNPSHAGLEVDDQTVNLVCEIADNHGFGGVVVLNAIPKTGANPTESILLAKAWAAGERNEAMAMLLKNLAVIRKDVRGAGAVLIAWGALAGKCKPWTSHVLDAVAKAVPAGVPVYCLAKTAAGHPKHPMARGRHKVFKDAALHLFETAHP